MSSLHDFARTGNIKGIRELLQNGADPNGGYSVETPLHILASKIEKTAEDIINNLEVAKELIERNANVNRLNWERQTPLMLAARAVKCGMVDLLLDAGADVNIKDGHLNSAMHHATSAFHFPFTAIMSKNETVINSKLHIVKTLLKKTPQLDAKNKIDQTPLMIAVKCGEFPIIQCLLNHGASVNCFDTQGESVLHHVFRNEVNIDILLELLRYGGEFGSRNKNGQTPFDKYLINLTMNFSRDVKHAKSVIRISMLIGRDIGYDQQMEIERICGRSDYNLLGFIGGCSYELHQMKRDELAPNYCVHDITLRGFLKSAENDPVPDDDDVFDKVIDEIIKGEYSIYGDMIVNGIRSPYWNKKFAEICSERTFGDCLIYDELYKLSFYLSRLEMLSLMVAFAAEEKWDLKSHIWNMSSPIPTAQ